MSAIFYSSAFIDVSFSIGKPAKIIKIYVPSFFSFFFSFLDFYFAFFLCGKYLLVDKHLEGCGIKFLKFFITVKWESMSLSNVNTSCRIKTAGQWNVVFRQNLLSGTYKFLDNAENNKFILFLKRNAGLTAV